MKLTLTEMSEGFLIAFQTLKSNRLRTILTTLGIFIGVIVVTVIISVIQGLNNYVSGEISGLGADTIYISKWPWIIKNYEDYINIRKRKRITKNQYEKVKKLTTLAETIAPEITTQKKVKFKNESVDRVFITGTTDDYMTTANVMPEQGRFFSAAEVDFRRNICVIGWDIADKLFNNSDPIGKRIKIASQPFFIVGLLEKRGEMFGHSLDNMTLIPYTVFQKYFGTRRSLTLHVKAKDPKLINELTDQLTGIMRQVRGIEAGRPNDFSINQQGQLIDVYNKMTRILWIVLIGIGSISLLVGGIGIMNIMLVSVTERTREIGIRKAVGAKKRIIMWQFLVESIFISGIGVTLGILFSIGIAIFIRSISPIPVNISFWILLLGILFTVTIGIFFGLYPAAKAARLDPIEALRYE
jgi:putative ABC transport system permease protein